MKKLLLVFAIIFAVVLIAGCSARRNKTEFAKDETKTVVTSANEEISEPLKLTEATRDSSGALTVTSLTNNSLKTDKPYNLIRGTAPKNTAAIEVNGYRLRKFYQGQANWKYIASVYINTLKPGDNDYAVKALDAAGKVIAETNFTITYNQLAPHLPGTGSNALALVFFAVLLSLFLKLKKLYA